MCNAETQFECKDDKCIPKYKVCDGKTDCSNDEENCEKVCRPNQFKCKLGECIDKKRVCDFTVDCSNGIDEQCGGKQK